jgi:hypothetical protein
MNTRTTLTLKIQWVWPSSMYSPSDLKHTSCSFFDACNLLATIFQKASSANSSKYFIKIRHLEGDFITHKMMKSHRGQIRWGCECSDIWICVFLPKIDFVESAVPEGSVSWSKSIWPDKIWTLSTNTLPFWTFRNLKTRCVLEEKFVIGNSFDITGSVPEINAL